MRRLLTCLLLLPLFVRSANAQITKDNYFTNMPPMSKIVAQTRASEEKALYGDRSSAHYHDEDANGIDDTREIQLHAIARRFSPILRQNNFSFPRDFRRAIGNDDVLVVDTWHAGRLVSSEKVRLGWSASAKGSEDLDERRRLAGLIEWSDPLRGEPRYMRPDDYDERVLYVDFPGQNPVTWREAYHDADPSEATVHTHFFIYEDTAAATDRKYHLVAQDWFFYPFNDSGNNHEGDWEHINVMIVLAAAPSRLWITCGGDRLAPSPGRKAAW